MNKKFIYITNKTTSEYDIVLSLRTRKWFGSSETSRRIYHAPGEKGNEPNPGSVGTT